MVGPTHITYLFDPLCGWCYGASPVLEKLASLGDFEVELVPTGLFAGEGARPMDENFAAYAWSNDQRISRLTGQAFSEDYRRRILADHTRLLDSGPATLALTAVALCAPCRELDALKAIQRARYQDGRDNTDGASSQRCCVAWARGRPPSAFLRPTTSCLGSIASASRTAARR